MKLLHLGLRGLSSAFPNVVDLPLCDIPPGLVALVGPNGQGKTTLLETTPGAIYRRLPARNGVDPIEYAIARDSYVELEFSVEGGGAYRVRLNLDGPKRKGEAVLELIEMDGSRIPLNDGKLTTFDAAIRERFPSFDLFINSAFAAQGRGDEFTRRKPSQRKDLFTEFLSLWQLLEMSDTAKEAADLADMARVRLTSFIEQLERDTADALLAALDAEANRLQTEGGAAELRKGELQARLADLETRSALLGDQVAAYAAATNRVHLVSTELAARRTERARVDTDRARATETLAQERKRITDKRDAADQDAATKIAGNQKIQEQATEIRAAVNGLATVQAALVELRGAVSLHQGTQRNAENERRALERRLAELQRVDERLTRAKTDAGLLSSVPCGGEGEYAACSFLVNAKAAEGRIAALELELRPKAELADQIGGLTGVVDAAAAAEGEAQRKITALGSEEQKLQALAKYEAPLEASTARIAELAALRLQIDADADAALAEAEARYEERCSELAFQARDLSERIAHLEDDLSAAQANLTGTADANSQAAVLQVELSTARAEWDRTTTTLATVASGRQELERRRQEITGKRTRLADLRGRLARVEAELLEWRDLAKALGKGGLPDLEIDAAGPSISALTNELLLSCFGARFSLELVTQVAKADGGGMKDLFTVAVTDNEDGGKVRDISMLSGGEKVVVQEALMSAISIYVNQRSPMPIRTLWRDETGAALDPENAIRYVSMLRKVRELGGFEHVFFISHNPEAYGLADVQIRVGGGTAAIVYPPFEEAAA